MDKSLAAIKSKRQFTLDIQKIKDKNEKSKINSYDNIAFDILFGLKSAYYKHFSKLVHLGGNFEKWKLCFIEIYHDEEIDFTLYKKHSFLAFICLLSLKIINERFLAKNEKKRKPIIFEDLDKLSKDYFPHIYEFFFNEEKMILDIKEDLRKFFILTKNKTEFSSQGDIFNLFYQGMINPGRRHKLGEFFTPIPLARLMILESYTVGDKLLDPACGTGTFLIEAINQVFQNNTNISDLWNCLKNIHGVEINPITAVVARLNILIYVIQKFESNSYISQDFFNFDNFLKITRNIFTGDFLSDNRKLRKYDKIIGNPPWQVINGICSLKYKEFLKLLARKKGVGVSTQNISNLEISSLFLIKSVDYLKDGGKIGFILSAGLLNGAQNGGIRRFDRLKNVKIWKFDKDLFNIHNVCFFGVKGSQNPENKYTIPVETKKCSYNPISIKTGRIISYVPSIFKYNRKKISFEEFQKLLKTDSEDNIKKLNAGRLIPLSESIKYFNKSYKESFYREKFRQGACLGPRNLIFCRDLSVFENEIRNSEIVIIPDDTVRSKKYSKWDFKAYESAILPDRTNLFQVAKSTYLIPFLLLNTKLIYLPIDIFGDKNWTDLYSAAKKEKRDFIADYCKTAKNLKHYIFLNKIYKKNIKSGGSITDLFQNINHNNKLLNLNQVKNYKLVYNGIGSIVKSSIVKGNIIIDSSLYYYVPNSEEEAYYLMGILNSSVITDIVKNLGSTGANGSLRNIHKNPLDTGIPQYSGTKLQRSIIKLAKKMEIFVNEAYINHIESGSKKYIENYRKIKILKKTEEKFIIPDFLKQNSIEEIIDPKIIRRIMFFSNNNRKSIQDQMKSNKFRYFYGSIIKPRSLQRSIFTNIEYLGMLKSLNEITIRILELE